jgi:hypothetical protein
MSQAFDKYKFIMSSILHRIALITVPIDNIVTISTAVWNEIITEASSLTRKQSKC